ncbi:MAG TPA: hypothetical protein VFR03_13600 [Thermoanaerobaculia bacterium]|nr:hypothetical protein [Thermoanaerobaculia bacterium]
MIPRAVLAALLFLGLAACAGAAPRPARTVAFQTLDQRGIPGQSGGEIRQVARDEDSWRSLWAELREGGGGMLPEEPPTIDFDHEMAIVVAMPTQSCVSKVTIQSVVRQGSGAVVNLLEAPPAPNCVCFVSQRPLHVIRLPRIEGDVRFVAKRGRTPCGPNRD